MKSSRWTGGGEEASDRSLVEAYRAGDDQAYGELVMRYQIPLFRLLLGLLAVGDDAEELCEQVFVRAARHIEDLEDAANFYPWIIERGRGEAAQAVSEIGTVDTLAPHKHVAHAVRLALAGLSEEHRAVLILSELQGDAADSIAEALGKSPDEVRRLVSEAKTQFVAQLRELETEDEAPAGDVEPEALGPGAVVADRYRITGTLGAGGMGIVYAAHHEKLGKDVALKMLHARDAGRERVRARFEREAMVLGKLEHPAFVAVLDYGSTKSGQPFLVMERVDGTGLDDLLDEGPMPPLDALALVRDLLEALEYMHSRDVVHRDLKPENIILTGEGIARKPRILDLGIARWVATDGDEAAPRLTRRAAVMGTPAYMSPEQAAGDDVDARSDLYAITVMLYELLTGDRPFDASSNAQIMIMQISETPPTLADMFPEFRPSAALEELVARGLAKLPRDRFEDAGELRAAIERFLPEQAGGTGELSHAAG